MNFQLVSDMLVGYLHYKIGNMATSIACSDIFTWYLLGMETRFFVKKPS